MKEKTDLTRGWLRRAASDLIALDASLDAGALDAACFHAQQAAERYLKAYLIYTGLEFPFTHNLSKLVELCAQADVSFRTLLPLVESLTPYAVELRYDDEFWPSLEVAREARSSALAVKSFVLARLPG
jgi:HEPN domain-containing protein